MKRVLFLYIFLSFYNLAIAQKNKQFSTFVRSFEKNFSLPYNLRSDTCFSIATLLKISIKQNLIVFQFADNVPDEFKEELLRIHSRLDTKEMRQIFKREKNGVTAILQPFFLMNTSNGCKMHQVNLMNLDRMYSFDGIYQTNTVFLNEPIVLLFEDLSHWR